MQLRGWSQRSTEHRMNTEGEREREGYKGDVQEHAFRCVVNEAVERESVYSAGDRVHGRVTTTEMSFERSVVLLLLEVSHSC